MQRVAVICLAFQLLAIAGGAHADEVDDYIRAEMKERQIPGADLAIVQDGRVVKRAEFGLANVELNVRVNTNTVFEIGSLTKQLTAAGILLLSEEGKLDINAPIHQYLKGTPGAWRDITVRHLLTHTSGIKSYTGLDGFELRRHLTQAQFIAAIGALPLEFQPGDSWKYSNTGYSLLGYIIENITGKTYWNFMSARIFGPLQMSSTTNRLPALVLPNRASGYEHTEHVLINRDYDLTDVFSAGSVVSTVGDLLRWNASLDGGTILSPESRKEMWTPAKLNDGKPTRYGFGWRIDTVEGHANIGHGGSTSGFSATLQRFPEDRLAIIILT
ncbi:MAG: serine hydrolase domain-containing protein, partial [Limisphaerales bacterium]